MTLGHGIQELPRIADRTADAIPKALRELLVLIGILLSQSHLDGYRRAVDGAQPFGKLPGFREEFTRVALPDAWTPL